MLKISSILFFLCLPLISFSQVSIINLAFSQARELKVNAGDDLSLQGDAGITLGSSLAITGGTPAYSYLWLLGQTEIAGTQTIDVTAAGAYTLVVSDSKNCSASDVINVINTALPGQEEKISFIIYPNPAGRELLISVADDNPILSVDILSISGGILISPPIKNPSGTIRVNLESIQQGIYFARVKTLRFETLRSFIKN